MDQSQTSKTHYTNKDNPARHVISFGDSFDEEEVDSSQKPLNGMIENQTRHPAPSLLNHTTFPTLPRLKRQQQLSSSPMPSSPRGDQFINDDFKKNERKNNKTRQGESQNDKHKKEEKRFDHCHKCDICTFHDGYRNLNMQRCCACGIYVHEKCYGLQTQQFKQTSIKYPDWKCYACASVGDNITNKKKHHKEKKIVIRERPTKCALCPIKSGLHAMHPLYDIGGKNGQPLVKNGSAMWVHTLCAFSVNTIFRSDLVYGCNENGDFEWSSSSDEEDHDQQVLDKKHQQFYDFRYYNGNKMIFSPSVHHFVITSKADKASKECLRDLKESQELKCFICKNSASQSTEVLIQCKNKSCCVACHVGCARWGANIKHQFIKYSCILGESEFSCKRHLKLMHKTAFKTESESLDSASPSTPAQSLKTEIGEDIAILVDDHNDVNKTFLEQESKKRKNYLLSSLAQRVPKKQPKTLMTDKSQDNNFNSSGCAVEQQRKICHDESNHKKRKSINKDVENIRLKRSTKVTIGEDKSSSESSQTSNVLKQPKHLDEKVKANRKQPAEEKPKHFDEKTKASNSKQLLEEKKRQEKQRSILSQQILSKKNNLASKKMKEVKPILKKKLRYGGENTDKTSDNDKLRGMSKNATITSSKNELPTNKSTSLLKHISKKMKIVHFSSPSEYTYHEYPHAFCTEYPMRTKNDLIDDEKKIDSQHNLLDDHELEKYMSQKKNKRAYDEVAQSEKSENSSTAEESISPLTSIVSTASGQPTSEKDDQSINREVGKHTILLDHVLHGSFQDMITFLKKNESNSRRDDIKETLESLKSRFRKLEEDKERLCNMLSHPGSTWEMNQHIQDVERTLKDLTLKSNALKIFKEAEVAIDLARGLNELRTFQFKVLSLDDIKFSDEGERKSRENQILYFEYLEYHNESRGRKIILPGGHVLLSKVRYQASVTFDECEPLFRSSYIRSTDFKYTKGRSVRINLLMGSLDVLSNLSSARSHSTLLGTWELCLDDIYCHVAPNQSQLYHDKEAIFGKHLSHYISEAKLSIDVSVVKSDKDYFRRQRMKYAGRLMSVYERIKNLQQKNQRSGNNIPIIDPNITCVGNLSLLHAAVFVYDVKAIQNLLRLGADTSIRSDEWGTVFDLANKLSEQAKDKGDKKLENGFQDIIHHLRR